MPAPSIPDATADRAIGRRGDVLRFANRTELVAPSPGLARAKSSKEPKMRQIIRFAWGISSLGDFMVAVSDKGLVSVEFGSQHSPTEAALRARFPEADVIDSQDG